MPSWLKELIGNPNTNEFVASTDIAARDRIASPFYGYFVISWIILNWRLIYAAFFVDQAQLFVKTGLLRNEYIAALMPSTHTAAFYLQFLVHPFILAIAMIWLFPYGTRVVFRKHLRNKVALKAIELQELRKEKKEEVALSKEETRLLETEIRRARVEKEAEVERPELIWEKDFQKLKKNSQEFFNLAFVQSAVYRNDQLPGDMRQMLSYLHLLGLFDFDEFNTIKLTEKGKYFVRRYVEEKSST